VNRLAIFDCDGTLVDSQANICLAMEHCFEHFSLTPPPREQTRRIVGLSLFEAMQAVHPEGAPDLHVAMADQYKHAFHQMRSRGLADEPLYDGIADLIEMLDSDGWLLGVATGKSDRGLRLCLEHHGLHPRFVTLQTSDRHPSKPHPSMIEQAMADAGALTETTIMIGDTSYDMAMARAAGVTAIGVTWGYHEAEELVAAG
jgi:phosphoglycolate phosphatase